MHRLKQEQLLPISLETAWDFFATPKNLNEVTPAEMLFEVTSELPEKMYEGLIITYRIKPMLNISMNWCTEITHIRDHAFFVDEQRKGPYNIWHHEHHFKAVEGGTLMTDILHYDIGKSIFGWIAGQLFVHQKVKEIFVYRYKTLETYFSNKAIEGRKN
jgi:ligand-binding SRPBCC domain-containing protein